MVFDASLGFRGVSMAMKALTDHHQIGRVPSHEICIQWMLKFGLHKLSQPREKEDRQWIWMADHVVKAGPYKCLVIVGVRQEQLIKRDDLTLSMKDVTPLAIVPMKASNGKTISSEYEKLVDRLGIPRAIVIDHGSDLKSGTGLFCSRYSPVQSSYDVVHKIALELSHFLQNASEWQAFASEASMAKKELQLTDHHRIAPPNQRTKSRWMNVDVLTDWAQTMLANVDSGLYQLPPQLQWLYKYREMIQLWSQQIEVARITRHVVRVHGYSEQTSDVLQDHLLRIDTSAPQVEELACGLINFVEAESAQLEGQERLIGSTEVLESSFGWFKNLLGTTYWSKEGFGRLMLALAGKFGEISLELVQQALETVMGSDVNDWLENAFMS